MPSKSQKKLMSLVVPAFNEAAGLKTFYGDLSEILEKTSHTYDWEIIFIDDGSTDHTLSEINELRQKDPRVKWLSLSRNFGHQAALTAGFEYAKGDAVITMDCDLQHPVSLLPYMIVQWETGYDLVITIREDDPNSGFLKRHTADYFYRIINTISNIPIQPYTADFRLMSRKALNAFLKFNETHRFVRGMVSWMGFKSCELSYKPEKRQAGKSKYTLKKMVNLALDGLTSFSIVPLRISTFLGIFIFFGTLAYALYAIIIWFVKPHSLQVGWTSLLITINLLGGTILLFIGLLGEYIGRIYEQVKMRPVYLIDKMDGFEKE